jgi:hypothetical protein
MCFIVLFIFFIELSWSHDLDRGFDILTRVSSHFFFCFKLFFFLMNPFVWLIFFLILSFNIWFAENWISWLFYVWCFQ